MKLLRAEKVIDNVVIDSIEELTDMEPKRWKYTKALDYLKMRGEELRFYIDGERQFLNC